MEYNLKSIPAIRSFGETEKTDKNSVIFVRAVGCPDDLSGVISELDGKLGGSEDCAYRRVTSFPKLADSTVISRYTALYDRFCSGGDVRISDKFSEKANSELCAALRITVNKVRAEMPSMSESIKRNLTVSLFYWFDMLGAELFLSAEGKGKKFICSGKTGYREYAFCMLLAGLGADVLMLLPEGDIKLEGKLCESSLRLEAGKCGKADISEPKPVVKCAPVDLTRPDRKKYPAKAEAAPAQVNLARADRPAAREVSQTPQKELAYEQLAELASSVVMIAAINRDMEIIGSGSGIAINQGGYILTNFHVIKDGALFAVRLENDDKVYETCNVVKYHPNYDLAIIRIDAVLKPLRIYEGAAELKRGQKVVAIGSPMGLFNSVSDGIISGFRNIADKEMIQFTAPISGGSSGGAILNMQGEVIGISTAGIDGGQNLNLAVSYKDIKGFAGNFLNKF